MLAQEITFQIAKFQYGQSICRIESNKKSYTAVFSSYAENCGTLEIFSDFEEEDCDYVRFDNPLLMLTASIGLSKDGILYLKDLKSKNYNLQSLVLDTLLNLYVRNKYSQNTQIFLFKIKNREISQSYHNTSGSLIITIGLKLPPPNKELLEIIKLKKPDLTL